MATTVRGGDVTMQRRRFLALAGATAAGALLAACGESTNPTATTAASSATATKAPAAASPAANTTAPTVAVTTGSTTTAASATVVAAPATASATSAVSAAGSGVAGTARPAGSVVTGTTTGSAAAGTAVGTTVASAGGIQTLMVEAFDFGYRTMGSLPAGPTLIQQRNTGKEPHHTQVMLLNTGVDLAAVGPALAKNPDALFGFVSFVGGPGTVGPGDMSQAILDLKEGQYLIACFVQGMDMVPHLAKGMIMPLKVTAPASSAATLPAVNGTINMFDFNFEMPAMLPAGKSMYKIFNQGAQVHEFDVFQLAPGKTMDDYKKFFDPQGMPPMGPPPGVSLGGMQGLTKGLSGILPLDLKAGNYVASCLIPDQSKPMGDSHLHLGMIKGFTVQ